MRVEWSDRALDRVDEIADHIALDRPSAAERWVIDLFDTVERLSPFPESGRKVPEIDDDCVREIMFGAYRVIYQVRSFVEVLTIQHGRQLLGEGDDLGQLISQIPSDCTMTEFDLGQPVGQEVW
ncbi:MAG: type II toxin-antitoxin system RelE/ParE family toxin [Coriobacteriia bacterium]